MVYSGKPSKACHECRAKRRRCDYHIPVCGPCKRSETLSCGYRQEIDVMFKDQTERTLLREDPARRGKALSAYAAIHKPSITHAPSSSVAVEDLALIHFFRSHVCSSRISALVNLPTLSKAQSALLACMMAVGSAMYGIERKSPKMSYEAMRLHSGCLVAVNEALESPNVARSDELLLAVMLLNVFATTNDTPLATAQQAAHINGCTKLLEIRGIKQLMTIEGRLLFIQATVNVVSYCLQTVSYIPSAIHRLTNLAVPCLGEEISLTVAWICHKIRLQITDCFCELETGNIFDVNKAVDHLLQLDLELTASLEEKLDSSRLPCFRWNSASPKTELQPGEAAYQDFYGKNAIRTHRIMLHSLILRLLLSNSTDHRNHVAQLASSNSIIVQQQFTILESVPRPLALISSLIEDGTVNEHGMLSPPLGISHADAVLANIGMIESLHGDKVTWMRRKEPSILRSSRGYGLFWPLLLVAHGAQPGSEIRTEATKLLRQVGGRLGVHQASIFAERLKSTS